MPTEITTTAIPEGYTFLNQDVFISVKAKTILLELLEQSNNRDPDLHDMYIYNDFYAYALLDLIDKNLSTVHTKLRRKLWDEAMSYLEALAVFFDMESDWGGCDDGEHVEMTNKAFGSLLVAVLRAVKSEGHLDVEHYPSLETLLKFAAEWGDYMDGVDLETGYNEVCKAIGYRLFKDKTAEDRDLERARVKEWLATLSEETRAKCCQAAENTDATPEVEEWFEKGKEYDEDEKHHELVLSRVWKEYKDFLRGTGPITELGYDLEKWSDKERMAFSLDRESDESDLDEPIMSPLARGLARLNG